MDLLPFLFEKETMLKTSKGSGFSMHFAAQNEATLTF